MDASRNRQFGRGLLICLLLALTAIMSPAVSALELVFLSHRPAESVNRLANMTASSLQADVRVVAAADIFGSEEFVAADMVVLVCAEAMPYRDRIPANIPVIAALVPADSVTTAQLKSAVFLEPPFYRQIALARRLIGPDQPFGVLADDATRLEAACGCSGQLRQLGVKPYFIDEYSGLNRALVELLQNSEALIGIYDTELFSAANIKNILITAYRQSKPLIGPSSAYIRAGAMATTYSDLADVSRRLTEIISGGLQGDWPEPGYNPYFKVRYNEQVARSLNLILPDADKLADQLRKLEQP